jgi:Lon protease-like protein
MNVLVEGRGRFRIIEETEGRSYRTAAVEPLEDAEGEEPSEEETARTLEAFRQLATIAEADEVDVPGLGAGTPLSFQLAARVDFGTVLKQELLELRSERARLDRLVDLLAQAAGALAREREVRERASGNGKVTRD